MANTSDYAVHAFSSRFRRMMTKHQDLISFLTKPFDDPVMETGFEGEISEKLKSSYCSFAEEVNRLKTDLQTRTSYPPPTSAGTSPGSTSEDAMDGSPAGPQTDDPGGGLDDVSGMTDQAQDTVTIPPAAAFCNTSPPTMQSQARDDPEAALRATSPPKTSRHEPAQESSGDEIPTGIRPQDQDRPPAPGRASDQPSHHSASVPNGSPIPPDGPNSPSPAVVDCSTTTSRQTSSPAEHRPLYGPRDAQNDEAEASHMTNHSATSVLVDTGPKMAATDTHVAIDSTVASSSLQGTSNRGPRPLPVQAPGNITASNEIATPPSQRKGSGRNRARKDGKALRDRLSKTSATTHKTSSKRKTDLEPKDKGPKKAKTSPNPRYVLPAPNDLPTGDRTMSAASPRKSALHQPVAKAGTQSPELTRGGSTSSPSEAGMLVDTIKANAQAGQFESLLVALRDPRCPLDSYHGGGRSSGKPSAIHYTRWYELMDLLRASQNAQEKKTRQSSSTGRVLRGTAGKESRTTRPPIAKALTTMFPNDEHRGLLCFLPLERPSKEHEHTTQPTYMCKSKVFSRKMDCYNEFRLLVAGDKWLQDLAAGGEMLLQVVLGPGVGGVVEFRYELDVEALATEDYAPWELVGYPECCLVSDSRFRRSGVPSNWVDLDRASSGIEPLPSPGTGCRPGELLDVFRCPAYKDNRQPFCSFCDFKFDIYEDVYPCTCLDTLRSKVSCRIVSLGPQRRGIRIHSPQSPSSSSIVYKRDQVIGECIGTFEPFQHDRQFDTAVPFQHPHTKGGPYYQISFQSPEKSNWARHLTYDNHRSTAMLEVRAVSGTFCLLIVATKNLRHLDDVVIRRSVDDLAGNRHRYCSASTDAVTMGPSRWTNPGPQAGSPQSGSDSQTTTEATTPNDSFPRALPQHSQTKNQDEYGLQGKEECRIASLPRRVADTPYAADDSELTGFQSEGMFDDQFLLPGQLLPDEFAIFGEAMDLMDDLGSR